MRKTDIENMPINSIYINGKGFLLVFAYFLQPYQMVIFSQTDAQVRGEYR